MEPAHHRRALLAQGAAVAALDPSALTAPVAGCPGWTVERLIGHLGRVHAWAASFVANGAEGGPADAGPRPPAGVEILDWYATRLAALVAELDRHSPTERVTSFAGPADVAFWWRRQAQETAVHRWDLEEAAAPGSAAALPAALAADGIDEWLAVFVPHVLAGAGGPPPELVGATLHLHCTDDDLDPGDGEWLLRLTAEGCEAERAHAKGDAALRGPASEVLLALWHRRDLNALDVVGDSARAKAILDAVHVT